MVVTFGTLVTDRSACWMTLLVTESLLLDVVGSGVGEATVAELMMVGTVRVGSKVAVTVNTADAPAASVPVEAWLQATLVATPGLGLTEHVNPKPAGGVTETLVSSAAPPDATG